MSVPQYLQGHTPHDRLSYLLAQLCDKLDEEAVSDGVRDIAHQAKRVIDGFDDYVARMSSPHPQIIKDMINEGNKRDWDAVHKEGKTLHKLIPEMTAGGYEATVLQHLAKISKVSVSAIVPNSQLEYVCDRPGQSWR